MQVYTLFKFILAILCLLNLLRIIYGGPQYTASTLKHLTHYLNHVSECIDFIRLLAKYSHNEIEHFPVCVHTVVLVIFATSVKKRKV